MADYYDGQITLMGINDSAAKVTFNATLREGYTRTMLADTIAHYCAFMVAVRDGVRQLDKQWGGVRPDYEYTALSPADYLINLWGGSKSGSMNFFTEHSTAQSALDFYWQCKDDLAAIDLARVLEVANEGEKPATLQPDTPYPVPSHTIRALRDGELPTVQAAVASRKRHKPFVPKDEITVWELGDNPDYDGSNDDYLIGDDNEHPSATV